MTIFDVLTMVGGLCLFLFGMNIMGDGLERRAGSSQKVGNPAFFEKLDVFSRKYKIPQD